MLGHHAPCGRILPALGVSLQAMLGCTVALASSVIDLEPRSVGNGADRRGPWSLPAPIMRVYIIGPRSRGNGAMSHVC